MLNFKIAIKKEVIEILMMYKEFCYEVGGMLFGSNVFSKLSIKAISTQKGKPFSITFSNDKSKIYYPPYKQRIIGTWHLHPNQQNLNPSYVDLNQWRKWNKKYIHLLSNGNKLKIYNYKGDCLYETILESI